MMAPTHAHPSHTCVVVRSRRKCCRAHAASRKLPACAHLRIKSSPNLALRFVFWEHRTSSRSTNVRWRHTIWRTSRHGMKRSIWSGAIILERAPFLRDSIFFHLLIQPLHNVHLTTRDGRIQTLLTINRAPIIAQPLEHVKLSICSGIHALQSVHRTSIGMHPFQQIQVAVTRGIRARKVAPRVVIGVQPLHNMCVIIQRGMSIQGGAVMRTALGKRPLQNVQMARHRSVKARVGIPQAALAAGPLQKTQLPISRSQGEHVRVPQNGKRRIRPHRE